MSMFEFREWIESATPWWAPFVVACVAFGWIIFDLRAFSRRK
jgi:hypothetical protein